MEVNNTSIVRVSNDQVGSYWGWDDDDRGMGMDIQALLSEFGGFGDFFENDTLSLGEVIRSRSFNLWCEWFSLVFR